MSSRTCRSCGVVSQHPQKVDDRACQRLFAMASAAPRRPKKVAKYDEYGNYLGDFYEDPTPSPAPAPPPAPVPPTPSPTAPAQPVASGLQARATTQARPTPLPRPPSARANMGTKRGAAPPRSPSATYYCGVDTSVDSLPSRCAFTASSDLELMLHRADRHLIYPPGGLDELRRRDPMRVAEERERLARQRKGVARAADGPPDSTILGLNIKLDTPELIEEWIRQRRKRFPTSAVIQEKAAKQREREQKRLARQQTTLTPVVPLGVSKDTASSDSESEPDTQPILSQEDQHDPTSSSSSSSSSPSESSSDSDMDEERDAISSKIEPPLRPEDLSCEQDSAQPSEPHRKRPSTTEDKSVRRVVPRRAPPNPFEAPDLLRQLLEREILQHVDALAQFLQFLLDNDMLMHVERNVGDAAAQRARRERVVVLNGPSTAPSSPPLRALSELQWPDEPDPLIYLDPLRASDPKPLRLADLEALATDTTLRDMLHPRTAQHPQGEENRSLRRALETWEALPTSRHRDAALQLILGVSAHSPMHAHEAYMPPQQRTRSVPVRGSSLRSHRVIGETELFRLGLRVAPNDVELLQHMAERVAVITKGVEYEYSL